MAGAASINITLASCGSTIDKVLDTDCEMNLGTAWHVPEDNFRDKSP